MAPVDKNNLFIAVISVLCLMAIIVYTFPNLVFFLFQYFLGNLILIAFLVGFGRQFGWRWASGIGILFLIMYLTLTVRQRMEWGGSADNQEYTLGFWKVPVVEGFKWSDKEKDDFLAFEKTMNPSFTFNMDIVQEQASPEELEELLKTGKWPWSKETIDMYKIAVMKSNTIKMQPDVAVNYARSIYNETAVKQLLSWNTKEGTFLLNGANIGHPKDMPDNINNVIRCGVSKDKKGPNKENGKDVMQKVEYIGYSSINGDKIRRVTDVADADIPSVLTGFEFVNGPCNPCVALENPPNYSCPFSLDVGSGGDISSIWMDLWGLNGTNTGGDSQPSDVNDEKQVTSDDFPLLSQLADEIENVNDLVQSNS